MSIDNNPAFCVAPWMHAHVAADGNRKLCCMADQAPKDYARMPWSEFKNSDYMKSIRTQMLSGVMPKECHYCANPIKSESYKDSLNNDYKSDIEDIFKSTSVDGSTNYVVKYVDYRSNLCNLKCRICTPDSSSSYQNFINLQSPAVAKNLFGENYQKDANSVTKLFSQNYIHELFAFSQTESVNRFYFAGGEPVIEPNHLPLLQSLVEQNKSRDITLIYNTNLNYPAEVLQKWLGLLKKFKNCFLMVSTDGYGEICEYLREGLVFEKHDKNIDALMAGASENVNIQLDFTLTSLNLFFLEIFADYVLSKKINLTAKLIFRSEKNFPLLHTEAISEEHKQMLLQRWKKYFQTLEPDQQKLLNSLNQTLLHFAEKKQWTGGFMKESLHKLDLFESMYPEKKKFTNLLKRDAIGNSWAQTFTDR